MSYYNNLFTFDYEVEPMFIFESMFTQEQQFIKNDIMSFEDIKSTEEVSSKRPESSWLSNVADVPEQEFSPQIDIISDDLQLIVNNTRKFSNDDNDDLVNSLSRQVKKDIYSNKIDMIIDEAIGFEKENEIIPDISPLIQIKRAKTSSQKVYLEAALKQNPYWDTDYMKKLAQDLGLTRRQVYKWFWDKTKKGKISF